MTWNDYPLIKPDTKGYYMTVYFDPLACREYWKAIWYDPKDDRWWPWRLSQDDPEVIKFVPESRHDYYVPCVMWYEQNHGK